MPNKSHSPPTSPEEKRLPWFRRPRIWLGLMCIAMLFSIPLAVRKYHLSLIPDIEEPFTDLPTVQFLPYPDHDAPALKPLLEKAQQLYDVEHWLGIESPTTQQCRDFHDAVRHAIHHHLREAPLPVVRFASENDELIRQWFQVLELYAREPPEHDLSSAVNPCDILDVVRLVGQRQVLAGDANEALRYLVEIVVRLRRLPQRTCGEFMAVRRAEYHLYDALLRVSENPKCDSRSLGQSLTDTLSWESSSPELRLALLHDEYSQVVEDLNLGIPQGNHPESFVQRQAFHVLGEPELAKRIVRQLYSGYRSQLHVPHRNRTELVEVARGSIKWFEDTGSPDLSERNLTSAFHHSFFYGTWGCLHLGAVLEPWLLQSFEHETVRLRQLRVALACQIFLRKHGSLPESLDELVPEILPTIPDDPMTKSETHLLYRNTGNFAVIYSRGWNGIDDGGFTGTGFNPDRPFDGWNQDDFGILIRTRINHPEQAEEPEKTE